jgi:hypothetical protein
MSSLRFFLLISSAVALFGQTDQNAAPNSTQVLSRAVHQIVRSSLGLARPPMSFVLNQPGPQSALASRPDRGAFRESGRCSVPLLDLKIPENTDFTIKKIKPPQDFTDHIGVTPEVPACPGVAK